MEKDFLVNTAQDPLLTNNLDSEQLSNLQNSIAKRNGVVIDLIDELKETEEEEVTEEFKTNIDDKLIKYDIIEVNNKGEVEHSNLTGNEYLEDRIYRCKSILLNSMKGQENLLLKLSSGVKDFFSFTFNSADGLKDSLSRCLLEIKESDFKKGSKLLSKDEYLIFNINGKVNNDICYELKRLEKTFKALINGYTNSVLDEITTAESNLDNIMEQSDIWIKKFKGGLENDRKGFLDYFFKLLKRPQFRLCNIPDRQFTNNLQYAKSTVPFLGNYRFIDIMNKPDKFNLLIKNKELTLNDIITEWRSHEKLLFEKDEKYDQVEKEFTISYDKKEIESATISLINLLEIFISLENVYKDLKPGFFRYIKNKTNLVINSRDYSFVETNKAFNSYDIYYRDIFNNYVEVCDNIQTYLISLVKGWIRFVNTVL